MRAPRLLSAAALLASGPGWLACSRAHPPAPPPQAPRIEVDSVPTPEGRDAVVPVAAAPPVEPTPWTDSILPTLSLRAKVAQLFVRWVPADAAPGSAPFERALGWVRDDSLGGVIVGVGTAAQMARTTNALQSAAPLPVIVAADLEYGPGQRVIPEGTSFPYPMGMAATRDTTLSCAQGRITAREARAVGIHWTLTPDVDLNRLPDNPSIGVRAYSDTAPVVERFARAFIRCAQDGGLMTTAKHLAGTGAVNVDTHLRPAVYDVPRPRLDSAEFRPFRAAQGAGVAAIMSAHVRLPGASDDSLPASLSAGILGGIVRREWGYDGLLVTDALWMKGVGAAEADPSTKALLAGNDVLLDPADHVGAIDRVVASVERGAITIARLDSSVRRVLRAKERLGLHRRRLVDTTALATTIGAPDADSIASAAARQSISLARDRGNALWRLGRARRVLAVLYLDEGAAPQPGTKPGAAFTQALRALLRERGQRLDVVTLTRRSTNAQVAAARARAASAEAAILAHYARPVASKGYAGVPARIAELTTRVIAAKPNTIVVSFGDPYMVRQFPAVNSYLLAWNPLSPWSERAAATAIAGRPARDAATMRATYDTVRAVLERFRADSAFPGAFAVIGSHEGVLASVGVGTTDWSPSSPVTDSTLWDLASLTKVVGMTSAIMQLVGEGKVKLDAPVQRYLPRWRGPNKRRVTVRHLLTHSSGMPAWRPLHKEGVNADSALALVYATPLEGLPGARMVYSDLGAILLGQIVEKVSRQKLDTYLRRRVYGPLELRETVFRPDTAMRARIAPTEYDSWRQRLIWGVVHDENAFALGGVSGHAGLFGSARDLARIARMYLNHGVLDGVRVLPSRLIYDFARVQDSTLSNRAVGWEKPTGYNSAGRRMSPAAFGHTGFTGTSLWIDPANDVYVVLLTNRVNPTRQNPRFGEVRIAVADAALAVLGVVRQPPATPHLIPRQQGPQ